MQSSQTYSFGYNGLGQRVSSNYNYINVGGSSFQKGELTAYSKKFSYDHGGRLICETNSRTYYQEGGDSYEIVYLYDDTGIVGMVYTANNTQSAYYFQRNLMGDIVAIYDTVGAKVAEYTYDAWGNCKIESSTTNYTVANANPFRYRGYYYDTDTGLYYLNARYYSPEWRRFISPDNTAYLNPKNVNGCNLYAYCNNDPVNFVDPSGNAAILLTIFDWQRGLPIFGHTVLLIEVDKKWYRTEFASGMPEYKGVVGFISALFQMEPHIDTSKHPIDKDAMLNGLNFYMMTEFTGDFSASLTRAQNKEYHKENYDGNYKLTLNNCAHYVADVLLQSPDLGEHIRNYYEKKPIVPIFMHITTNFIHNHPHILETLSSWWGSFTSYFMGG